MRKTSSATSLLIIALCLITSGHAQSATQELPERLSEVDEDDLILLNVAAKGRVVELLANELARTEIIRALLVEYARECARNVTVLEKHCLDCMMERCSNRILECGIDLPPLSEVISHNTSPIKGLEFLSKPPTTVEDHMNRFVKTARSDILEDVPDRLLKESQRIVEEEVDQSLKDLNDNRDTETALRTLKLHVHSSGDVRATSTANGVVVVISHGDRNMNVAELLSKRLRDSRPLLERMTHHGAEALKEMPTVMEHIGARLEDFKQTISGVFSSILDGFQESMNQPNTAVINGNTQQFSLNQRFPQGPGTFPQGQGAFTGMQRGQMVHSASNPRFPSPANFNQGHFNAQKLFRDQQQVPPNPLADPNAISPNQIPQMNVQIQSRGSQGVSQGQFLQQQNAILANPTLQSMVTAQGLQNRVQGQMSTGQGQTMGQSFQNMPQTQGQTNQFQSHNSKLQNHQQGQNFPGPTATHTFQGQSSQFQGKQIQGQSQSQGNNFQVQSQNQRFQGQFQGQNLANQPQGPNFQAQNFQTQAQVSRLQGQDRGRRKREVVACGDLKADPETHCRKFEAQCHNCTLEKRLRFEVCGDGVERARDEIKRLDNSVDMYLEAFETYIVGNRLILKIELDDSKRLHKTNTYNDAYITAKIGPSILRFRSKMILNINNIRVSGSQIGDELWEKLWENGVFKEAERVEIPPKGNDIMGQTHNHKIDTKNISGTSLTNQKSSRHTSDGNVNTFSAVTFTISIIVSLVVVLV